MTLLLVMILFLMGLYFYVHFADGDLYEPLANMNDTSQRCPNLLIQKGNQYYLYNSKLAPVPGVNPIVFNNLEEYTEFLEWQQSVGIRCPVLYVQQMYDAQGNRVYRARPSVSDVEGGLPPTNNTMPNQPLRFQKLYDATRDNPPYNQNNYPGFDPTSQYVGVMTPLDTIKNSQEYMLYSDNAMDPNWGGNEYTQSLVNSGYYRSEDQPAYTGVVSE